MPIDIQHETLLPLHQAPEHIPGRPHISTLHRWRLRGVRGAKLETRLIGGRRYTSLEALARFSDAATAAASQKSEPTPSPQKHQRGIQEAEELLRRDGIDPQPIKGLTNG